MNPRHHHTASAAGSPRRLLGIALAALCAIPIGITARSAGAAPAPVSTVRLTDVQGTRVARAGAPSAVTATVTNEGAAPATGVVVRYHLPSGVEFVADASTAGCTAPGAIVECTVGALAPGASTPVAIGVREPSGSAVLGTRTGYFLPPTTDQYDPEAGELLVDTWYHEAGLEGTDLAICWPLTNPSPNMDVAGGTCDGVNDVTALDADETAVLDAFPAPYSQSLVRSWQFETRIVVPVTGSYRVCGTMIDDGGYVAIAPVGQPITAGDIAVRVLSYDSATSTPLTLAAGTSYRVVMRVSNRGFDGVDNGADGGTLAGWDAFGIAPADEPCDAAAAGAFGTADTALVDRRVADVIVVGTSDLLVGGAIEAAPVDGRRHVSVRVVNDGSDTTGARITLGIAGDARLAGVIAGCDRTELVSTMTCEVDTIRGRTAPTRRGHVLSFSFVGPTPGVTWDIESSSTIDTDTTNNDGPRG